MASCHRCGEENPDRARFCPACGAQLHATCPSCGEQNPPTARFCVACGNALDVDVPATPPRELRKTVTVVFCDVTGSTTLGERLDPESLRRVMGRYFDEMRAALERHGGTVEKFIGDAVVAVFGIPAVHEDDALRAVRAAAEMRRERDRLNEELERTWGVRIQARIGVNTGEVVAGDSSAGERFATGDTMNVAARLEQSATGGEILIGEETYRLVRDAVRVEPVEPLALKGKSERVPAYRLVDVDLWAAGYTRRLDSPLVGRNDELAQLRAEFDAVCESPQARLVTVLGAAGLGKSRLTNELAAGLGGTRVLRGRCLSYGEGVGFWPVLEIVRDAAGITETDSLDEARARITALLPDGPEATLVAERALAATGIGGTTAGPEETFWGVRKLLESIAEQTPLVIVVDDCHWAATAMLDLLEYIAAWSTAAPILLLCLARPELLDVRPTWTPTIVLSPLRADESSELLDRLVENEPLAPTGRARVLELAEGNPLFLEQLVALIRDAGDDLQIPPSMQALLAARLDRLTQDERQAVERGAVEGKVFHRGAVQHLTPEPTRTHVPGNLLTLVRKDLIGPDRSLFPGDDAFRFRNMVVRDVAYESTPKQLRAELHERFADWLAIVATGDVQELDEIVAYHLDRAHGYLEELGPADEHARGLGERAAELYVRTGRAALARGDIGAARQLLGRAAALFSVHDPRRAEVLPELGYALRESGDFAGALAVLEEGRAAADPRMAARAEVERSLTRLQSDPHGATDEALDVAERVIPVLDRLGDDRGLAKAWKLLASWHWFACNSEASAKAYEHVLDHAQRAGDRGEVVEALGASAFAAAVGYAPLPEASARCDVLEELAAGAPSAMTSLLGARANIAAMAGDFAAAREYAAEAKRLFDELGMLLAGHAFAMTQGRIELMEGRPEEAERIVSAAAEALEALGERSYLSTMLTILAEAVYDQGRYAEVETLAARACELGAEDDVAAQAPARAVLAKAFARSGRFEEARELAREAVGFSASTDILTFRGDMEAALAEVLALCGETDAADAARRTAIETYELKGNVAGASSLRERLQRIAA
jgi:class 3 adenylate cyclase/tetratricopeptide (TPR) repeat protein